MEMEGERSVAKNNHLLGSFTLENIPNAKKGTPKIDVSFDIDQNGILKVSAHEKAGGSTAGVTITNDQNRLTKEQIEGMVEEGAKFAREDAVLREAAAATVQLRAFIEKQRNYPGLDKLKNKDRRKHDKALDAAEEFLKNAKDSSLTSSDINAKLRETEAIVTPITGLLYDGGDAREEEETAPADDDTRPDEL